MFESVWSLERIEIFVTFANCQRIKNWQLECGCSHYKIRFFNFQGTDQVSHASYQTRNFHAYTRNRVRREIVDANISTEINETQILNRPLRPARRSDFDSGRRSSVFRWSGNTNQREERVGNSQDIRNLRGRSFWSIEEGLTGNRVLRPARRSYFGPGRRSRVSVRSGNTNPRGEKFCQCRNISAARQNNTKKSVHPYFLIQGSTILSGWFLLQEPI